MRLILAPYFIEMPKVCHFFHRFPSQKTPHYFPSMRPFYQNSWSPSMRSLRREEGGEKLRTHGEPCHLFLTVPIAPCTVLKPVLQFCGLA